LEHQNGERLDIGTAGTLGTVGTVGSAESRMEIVVPVHRARDESR
jgi:hypothetical protein